MKILQRVCVFLQRGGGRGVGEMEKWKKKAKVPLFIYPVIINTTVQNYLVILFDNYFKFNICGTHP